MRSAGANASFPKSPALAAGLAAFRAALLALLVGLFASSGALAGPIPALTGRIVDNANIIDEQTRATIVTRLEAYEKRSTDQIIVATIETTEGEEINAYANRMFRTWKIGRAGVNNGVLLLVARGDRKMRIEVGYGLARTLSDKQAAAIIAGMIPRFRAGDFAGGIDSAVGEIVTALQADLPCRSRNTC